MTRRNYCRLRMHLWLYAFDFIGAFWPTSRAATHCLKRGLYWFRRAQG
jgi:hypothetical protein